MLADSVALFVFGDTFAYVDGGTGSLIFQVAIGGALSGLYFVSTQWRKLGGWAKGFLRKDSTKIDS